MVMPYTSTLRTLVNDKDTLPEHKYTEVLREIRKEIQEAVYAFGELEKNTPRGVRRQTREECVRAPRGGV